MWERVGCGSLVSMKQERFIWRCTTGVTNLRSDALNHSDVADFWQSSLLKELKGEYFPS